MATYRVTDEHGATVDIEAIAATVQDGVLTLHSADPEPVASFMKWTGYVNLDAVNDPAKQATATLDKLHEALAKHGRSTPAA